MTSTGNDIVSLRAIDDARTKQYRFYSKILSPSEQTLYNETEFAALPFENFVWLLWSIKESAFKYQQRTKPDLIFSPTKFIIQQVEIPFGHSFTNFAATEVEGTGFDSSDTIFCTPTIKGKIRIGIETLYSRSIINKDLILSMVNSNEKFENTGWGVKLINDSDPNYQSAAAREFLINRLNSLYSRDDLKIDKNPYGFPVVRDSNEHLAIPVSLSHHDHLVAYSFQTLPPFN